MLTPELLVIPVLRHREVPQARLTTRPALRVLAEGEIHHLFLRPDTRELHGRRERLVVDIDLSDRHDAPPEHTRILYQAYKPSRSRLASAEDRPGSGCGC